jgi:hypothetical protein
VIRTDQQAGVTAHIIFIFVGLTPRAGIQFPDCHVRQVPIATRTRCSNDAYSITSAARSRIEVGVVMPNDLVASYFTTTVVPTDTRL